jgi:hypothetical protein
MQGKELCNCGQQHAPTALPPRKNPGTQSHLDGTLQPVWAFGRGKKNARVTLGFRRGENGILALLER